MRPDTDVVIAAPGRSAGIAYQGVVKPPTVPSEPAEIPGPDAGGTKLPQASAPVAGGGLEGNQPPGTNTDVPPGGGGTRKGTGASGRAVAGSRTSIWRAAAQSLASGSRTASAHGEYPSAVRAVASTKLPTRYVVDTSSTAAAVSDTAIAGATGRHEGARRRTTSRVDGRQDQPPSSHHTGWSKEKNATRGTWNASGRPSIQEYGQLLVAVAGEGGEDHDEQADADHHRQRRAPRERSGHPGRPVLRRPGVAQQHRRADDDQRDHGGADGGERAEVVGPLAGGQPQEGEAQQQGPPGRARSAGADAGRGRAASATRASRQPRASTPSRTGYRLA